ncbi:MAG TPA: hypothetical protein VLA92_01430 [Candidatus Saccharimonadales bacterium]|nr:hypothetical protein [Candidatus Saccharimonadales bacterium]
MNLHNNQKGVAHIAVIVVILLLVIGFAGYRVTQYNDKNTTAEASVPNKIESKGDIDQASKALDEDQQDNSMDPGQLDSDLNELL